MKLNEQINERSSTKGNFSKKTVENKDLSNLGVKGESFDFIIRRLLDQRKDLKEKNK